MSWSVLGESVAGTAHLARNLPCQDAFRFRLFGTNEEWLLLVVTDGAGSASHSEHGARVACDEFIRRIETSDPAELFTRETMCALFTQVSNLLFVEAEHLGVSVRELACTLLLALVGPTNAVFAQVGDGAIVLGTGENYHTVFWPEPAEYANTTDFLTDVQCLEHLQFTTITDKIIEVAVFTDGLQRLALDFANRCPPPAFFQPLFNTLRNTTDPETLTEPFRQFLASPRVNERTDDDKTLLLALRRS